MGDLACERQDGVLILEMQRGKANALNRVMIEELNSAVDDAARDDGVSGIVLASACPRYFSAGFDLDEVLTYDRDTMTVFFYRFIDLHESLSLLPKPVVAAIAGQAVAGGAILALTADIRIMVAIDSGLSLNELDLGVVLPPGLTQMVVNVAGAGAARSLLLSGDVVTAGRALDLGLVNEIVPPDEVRGRSIERCLELAAKPPQAFAAAKRTIREICRSPFSRGDRNYVEEFLEHWFSAEGEGCREAVLAGRAARKSD